MKCGQNSVMSRTYASTPLQIQVKFATDASNTLDYLLGDLVTGELKDILYCTYNGDIDLIIKLPFINKYFLILFAQPKNIF